MRNKTQKIIENLIYLLIWAVVFAVPLIGYNSNSGIRWNDVKSFWCYLVPFFLLFAINNYLLLPFLFDRKRLKKYFLAVFISIFLIFIVYPALSGRSNDHRPPHRGEMFEKDRHNHMNFNSDEPSHHPEKEFHNNGRRETKPDLRPPRKPMRGKWVHIMNDWLFAILLVGFNVAIRLLFNSIADNRKMKELERQKLKAELNYLKGQINPHFFMNTLNNIHALIDLDTEKAKETIIELSKIMRYVLYEANHVFIKLSDEVQILNNYVALMSIRYSENVIITTHYPHTLPSFKIPPLLLITLLENAFKHGIVPDGKSHIHAELQIINGNLIYTVKNSLGVSIAGDGAGLTNLSKRLTLLFGDKYKLRNKVIENEYVAELIIPIQQ